MFDSPDGAHLSHMVRRSAHVWLQRTEDKMDEALEIQSADGTKTLVRFGKQDVGARVERLSRKGDDEDSID